MIITQKEFAGHFGILKRLSSDRSEPLVLTLRINLRFSQINPAHGNKTGRVRDYQIHAKNNKWRKIIPWDSDSWVIWKSSVARVAENCWDKQFYLKNNLGIFPRCDQKGTYAPNILCRLEAHILPDLEPTFDEDIPAFEQDETRHIKGVRLHPSERFLGSHEGLLNTADVDQLRRQRKIDKQPFHQIVAAHEFGHIIGLDHVDVGKRHCPANNPNARRCYGVSSVDKNSVMGLGMELRLSNADPWRRALMGMTHKGSMNRPWDFVASMARNGAPAVDDIFAGQPNFKTCQPDT